MLLDKRVCMDLSEGIEKKSIPKGWIYLGDEKERYLLGQPGKNNMLIVGVNPSTAIPGNLDPTLKKVSRQVFEYGYDGWIMTNLYPLRATKPKDLPIIHDEKLMINNLKLLEALVNRYYIGMIWAGWGNIIDTRRYLGEALKNIQKLYKSYQWYVKGSLTKKGNPRHPLYIKNDAKYYSFNVEYYIKAKCKI